jgi:hypothetical protein
LTIKHDQSDRVTQICAFRVDDLAGTINGIAVNAANYATQAQSKSKVIFSSIANAPQGFDRTQLARIVTDFQPNDLISFYAIQSGINGQTNTFFSTDSTSQTVTAKDLGHNVFNLNWHSADNRSLNLDLTAETTTSNSPIGASNQGLLLDFSQIVAPKINGNLSIYRDAAYNDSVGFYKVIDASGAIQTSNGILKPGDNGYVQAAIKNALNPAVGSGLDLNVKDRSTKNVDDLRTDYCC